VGFAMGIAGTQIAKDACDIVLLDDNFASIVIAAKWGRNIYASISKFLQFQLTVNIVAVSLAIVGSLRFHESPIAAVQMLWVNLIMDSLASLALSTEAPSEALLDRPPVNRSTPIVTRQMMFNMFGQAAYQLTITNAILFYGDDFFDVPAGYSAHSTPSVHYTILFNSFVLMTLFNEVNCRKLEGEFNVFEGILSNYWFVGVLAVTLVLQVLVVQFGREALKCAIGGLSVDQWLFCIATGAFSLVWQQLLNLAGRLSRRKAGLRSRGGIVKFESKIGSGYEKYRRINPYIRNSSFAAHAAIGRAKTVPNLGAARRAPSMPHIMPRLTSAKSRQ